MLLKAAFLLCLAPLLAAKRSFDPCTDHDRIFDNGGRSPVCPYHPDQCDRYITENWYKVVNSDGALEMPTTPVEVNSCGATYPLWLNANKKDCLPDTEDLPETYASVSGTYPPEAAGVINMTVCLSVVGSYCDFSYDIEVKNCGQFYVYYLRKAPGCSHRYCFGTNGVCPTNTTMTSTSKTPPVATATTSINAATHATPRSIVVKAECSGTSYIATTVALVIVAAFAIGGAFGIGLSYFVCGRKNHPYRVARRCSTV